ncbi:MAG: peptide chain release factor N(5)-glutamine methyltransferase, partial [Deltaproteobacteria bacterium]|nr:peptide chain release factor N(5)-glutamine methyltransferase [Deltaproteobacteria bacterium]
MNEKWTVIKLLDWAAPYLEKYGVTTPRLDAELLLANVLSCDRIDLYLNYDRPTSAAERAAFKKLLIRRREREPIAYILGEKEFWSLPFMVNSDVLIPRPETEHLVEAAIAIINQHYSAGGTVVDLGSGSGNILLSIAHHFQAHAALNWLGFDLSPKAVETASKNARRLKLERVVFSVADLAAVRPKPNQNWNIILSNPPYIPTAELKKLAGEVRQEPQRALDGGPDGLDYYRILSQRISSLLPDGGFLLVEVGDGQAEKVKELLVEQNPHSLDTVLDLQGIERVVIGRWIKS